MSNPQPGAIPPGEYAVERLNSVQINLNQMILKNNPVTSEMGVAIAAIQANAAVASALLDLAAAIRESIPSSEPTT